MSDKSQMNGKGESSEGVVPAKQPNEDQGGSKEAVEGRPEAKKNTDKPNSGQTQSRESESSGLARVRQAAKQDKKKQFTALAQLRRNCTTLLRSNSSKAATSA